MTMEYSNCDEAPVSISASVTAVSDADCMQLCALQQATSAQSLAASSCSCSTSTSACTDFSSSEGGFEDSAGDAAPADAAAAAAADAAAAGAAADTSVSLLSLTFDDESVRLSQLSSMKASSALSLMPQQQLPPLYSSLGQGCRPHRHQPQKQRRRSNAISAKSRSSYLAQYNEAKCAYFDGVLAGDIPVNQTSMAPKFN